ncbi:hypothetical protein MLD52_21800 [Puniceicoccaceae bacterium K14]|nr:hypothetical protein [Puniceicoccaceae bacterium K14]
MSTKTPRKILTQLRGMTFPSFFLLLALLCGSINLHASQYPSLYAKDTEREAILEKIENEQWAKDAWKKIKAKIEPHADRHEKDPEWIVSRLAMYWKDGERYTQCYIKKQDWDYGEGNAPVPTVRLPGMRKWNNYINVPLGDRIPYNETGDMLGIDRSSDDKTPVLVPYKESGHMIRFNNEDILNLAETAAFAYWLTEEEKYAKFSGDILNTWLLGIYYMEPPLDPDESTGGPGGYAPGGIMGYYDYEQIHDNHQVPAAIAYDFVHDYLIENPHEHLATLEKNITEVAGTVFKRFIDLGLVRGGKHGNWNVNGFTNIVPVMLALESNEFYEDGKGSEYYIPYYTEITTDYHEALPDLIKMFDEKTGLWPESPGYASGIISSVLEMAMPLYRHGVDTVATTPLVQKAAMANFGWLDARGNYVVFGDMRGGPASFAVFERMLTYYTQEGDTENARAMATVIRKGINSGQYDRSSIDWKGLCLYQPLPESGSEIPFHRTAYSEFHRHLIMKNGNSEEDGMMFTLYGGRHRSHLSSNGLAMQFYGKGYSIGAKSASYESYWSEDFKYHSGVAGSNTIAPGYARGEITVNAMDPMSDPEGLYNTVETSPTCSFADISADEKRRLVAMVRTSPTTGYYVDIFRSDQEDNDYIQHVLGNNVSLANASGRGLKLESVDSLGTHHNEAYSFFKNPQVLEYTEDFVATWDITDVSPTLTTDLWMMGQEGRELYFVDAPPVTLRSDITPGMVNKSPQTTPVMIVRQNENNAKTNPFVGIFEVYNEGEKAIESINKIANTETFVALSVESTSGSQQTILNGIDGELHNAGKKVAFQGTFGIAPQNGKSFEYLYLGSGTLIKSGKYQIESVDGPASAELRQVDGKLYYSSNKPIKITLKKGKTKEYPAGYDIEIN